MRIDREELMSRYEALTGRYEGYVQMSGGRIEDVWKEASELPSWGELHRNGGFIFEAVLYDPSQKRSILVRQRNEGWQWIEYENIDWEKSDRSDCDLHYSVFDGHTKQELRMVQIWERLEDPVSPGYFVLEPVAVVFAGFEKGGES
jgi:CRISPR type III-associated protein (TIGR04423 family)